MLCGISGFGATSPEQLGTGRRAVGDWSPSSRGTGRRAAGDSPRPTPYRCCPHPYNISGMPTGFLSSGRGLPAVRVCDCRSSPDRSGDQSDCSATSPTGRRAVGCCSGLVARIPGSTQEACGSVQCTSLNPMGAVGPPNTQTTAPVHPLVLVAPDHTPGRSCPSDLDLPSPKFSSQPRSSFLIRGMLSSTQSSFLPGGLSLHPRFSLSCVSLLKDRYSVPSWPRRSRLTRTDSFSNRGILYSAPEAITPAAPSRPSGAAALLRAPGALGWFD